ncbi:hypothetical protein [Pannonibacter phragmitetus]|uniref:hypothetical protein n=2 Tax=Pannonibacter phragmitetus TaxID=121719 RepID=UPI0013C52E38|nr:hypothetical protein [Pannonibacter phragmitetus]
MAATREAISPEAAVRRMLDLTEELISRTETENARLAGGLSVSLEDTGISKQELAVEFERWFRAVSTQQVILHGASAELSARLMQRISDLEPLLEENTRLLQRALAVSRRRVDAIMRAICEEQLQPIAYGSRGRYQQRRGNMPLSIHQPREI